jgi:hypothetical protein
LCFRIVENGKFTLAKSAGMGQSRERFPSYGRRDAIRIGECPVCPRISLYDEQGWHSNRDYYDNGRRVFYERGKLGPVLGRCHTNQHYDVQPK